MNVALLLLVVIAIGAGVGLSFLRGLPKTRIRSIRTLVCFGLAILITVLVKNSAAVSGAALEAFKGAIEGADAELIQALLVDGSVIGFAAAVVAPLIFLFCFIGLEIFTGIVAFIVFLALGDRVKRTNCNAKLKELRSAAWGVFAAIVILVVIITPISAYSHYAASLDDAIPQESSYTETAEAVSESADEIENSIVIKVHRTLFGWLDRLLSTFRIGEEKANAQTEFPVIASAVGDIQEILNSGDDGFVSSDNATPLRRIADGMGESRLLSSLVGTVVYEVTDDYLKDPEKVLEDEISYSMMLVLHEDARDPVKLRADFYTIANALRIYSLFGDDPEMLDQLLKILQDNPNMAPLMEEVKEQAAVSIKEELNFGKDEYGEYTEGVKSSVKELNEISALPKEDQHEKVAKCVENLLNETDVAATQERIDYFTGVVINELFPKQGGSLTPASTEDFLVKYITDHYSELKAKGLL